MPELGGGSQESVWGAGGIPFLDLGVGYMGVYVILQ